MNGLVFAAIAPHGGISIAEACAPDERDVAIRTRTGMEELAERFDAARPDVTVLLTPHNVHVEGAMAVVVAGTIAGALTGAASPVALSVPIDRIFAYAVKQALDEAGIPVVGVSYGGNDAPGATMPMDWATLVPLWFMGGRTMPPTPVVIVAPARDLSADAHIEAGRAIAAAARDSGKRVVLIASADNGHAHDANGPYGYDPAAQEYDRAIVQIVQENNVPAFRSVSPALVSNAKADSWWQLLMLSGALEGASWQGELLSYEAPTYFGMLCAAYIQRAVLAD